MTTTTKNFSAIAVLLIITLFASGCTPYPQQAYYPPQPQYEYNPGYNPNNVVAEAILAAAVINGITGYRYGGAFYPQAYYGGVPGYYVGGVFHTSSQYRTTIVNNYNTGRTEFQRNPHQYAQRNPTAVKTTTVNGGPGMPNYRAGGVTRGTPTAAPNQSFGMPNYRNTPGGVQRSSPPPAPTQSFGMPNYRSNAGAVTRSAPPPSVRSSSPTTTSSSAGRSTRR